MFTSAKRRGIIYTTLTSCRQERILRPIDTRRLIDEEEVCECGVKTKSLKQAKVTGDFGYFVNSYDGQRC